MEANVSVRDLYTLSIKGRINFLQLERYGKYSEQRYRQQFEKTLFFIIGVRLKLKRLNIYGLNHINRLF